MDMNAARISLLGSIGAVVGVKHTRTIPGMNAVVYSTIDAAGPGVG